MNDLILVTDWDKVDKDDFYLSDEWLDEIGSKKRQRELRRMAKNNELFEAFEVPAMSYAIYRQMDAHQVLINEEGDVLLSCESAIIDNDHKARWEVNY